MTGAPGRLSVISSVKNSAAVLEETIASVTGQDYENLEYIVVDGGSTDGTAEIVAAHGTAVSRFVSAKDRGVYFGMNRGVELATGEWIAFLNGGDVFCGPDVTTRIMAETSPAVDVIYGNHFFGDEPEPRPSLPFDVLWERLQLNDLDESWIIGFPCHQAVFVRAALLRELPYDTGFRHAAEQEFLFHAFAAGRRFAKSDVAVCRYEPGGMSHRRQIAMLLEKRLILRKYHRSMAIDRFIAGRIMGVVKRRLKERFFSK